MTNPEKVINGLDLLWKSDLVISCGGTMTREGVGLGVPAYSIFCGEIGGVDKYLAKQSRLTLIKDVQDIQKIKLMERDKSLSNKRKNNIVPQITEGKQAGQRRPDRVDQRGTAAGCKPQKRGRPR